MALKQLILSLIALANLFQLIESQVAGGPCTLTYDGSAGICSYKNDCPGSVQKLQIIGVKPDICFRTPNGVPVICCPERFFDQAAEKRRPPEKKPGVISRKKCQEYNTEIRNKIGAEQCEFAPLIIGGKKAKPKEFPHIAAVGFRNKENGYDWLCGGSLISESFVLTAAHCEYAYDVKASKVRLGEVDLQSFDDGSRPVDFDIDTFTVHPLRNNSFDYYDIALIRLRRQVSFNEYIRPTCLRTSFARKDTRAVVSGWGITDFDGHPSRYLLKVGLDVIDNEACSKFWDPVKRPQATRGIPDGIRPDLLCSGVLAGGRDACSVGLIRPHCGRVFYTREFLSQLMKT